MYYMLKKEKINPTYISKDDSKHEKQVILLTIEDKEKLSWGKKVFIVKKNMVAIFIVWVVFTRWNKKQNLIHIKKLVKRNIFVMWKCLLKTQRYLV